MSTIHEAYSSFQKGDYAKVFLKINHNCEVTLKILEIGLKLVAPDNNIQLSRGQTIARSIAAFLLMPAIPGTITSALALIKDTLLTISYLASTVILGLAAILTFGQFSCVNRSAGISSILALDSACNIVIDAIGIFCPAASVYLSDESYGMFKHLIRA